MDKNSVHLDVRADLRKGQEPFSRIMQAVASLGPNDELVLVVPFEPAPLYAVLAKRGFAHEAKQISDGDWEVRFFPQRNGVAAAANSNSPAVTTTEIDTRGLEPPQPLVEILQAVAALAAGAELKARTDRRPLHLYEQLIDRGYSGQTDELEDGSFVTHIRPLRRPL